MKAQITIVLRGQTWGCNLVSGSLNHIPQNITICTGEHLVKFCNRYGLQVLNKQTLTEDLSKKLKL